MTARDLVNGLLGQGTTDMIVAVKNGTRTVSEVLFIDYVEATNHKGEQRLFAILNVSENRVTFVGDPTRVSAEN